MELRTFNQLSVAAFSEATQMHEQVQEEYRSSRALVGYWLMMDLKGSAAFRQHFGEEPAFRRSVVFSRLIDRIASGYGDSMRVFKELGDGLLAFATDFRPVLELTLLMDAVREYWNVEVWRDDSHPNLESRTAITFGEGKVVGNDFLGAPIDQVARLSSFKSKQAESVAVVSAEVRIRAEREYESEYPFIRFDENTLEPDLFKAGEEPVWISEVLVDRAKRRDYSDFFAGARSSLLMSAKSN